VQSMREHTAGLDIQPSSVPFYRGANKQSVSASQHAVATGLQVFHKMDMLMRSPDGFNELENIRKQAEGGVGKGGLKDEPCSAPTASMHELVGFTAHPPPLPIHNDIHTYWRVEERIHTPLSAPHPDTSRPLSPIVPACR
jgi:hypothetical protein